MSTAPLLIAVQLPPSKEFLAALNAIWSAGNVIMPLSPALPADRLDALLTQFGVAELWDDEGTHQLTTDLTPPLQVGDAAVLLTSGTTGAPKGVIHTHDSISAAASLTATATETTNLSRWVCCLPVNHVGGFSVITRARVVGAALDLIPSPTVEDLDAALHGGATHISLVPQLLERTDPDRWQIILTGGSQSPASRGDNVIATYGLTETFGGVVYNGRALPGVALKTTGDANHPTTLMLQSPSLGRGYLVDNNVVSLTNDEGWLVTSDLATIDANATLTIHGRADDVIISGGENVWPERIESVLEQHPSIAAVAVVGLPSDMWGEQVTAVLELTPDHTAPDVDELHHLLTSHVERFALPRRVIVVAELPRTDLGKLQRKILRQRLIEVT